MNIWKVIIQRGVYLKTTIMTILNYFQKRRKELEESAVNDSLLLAKSSLDINLLPEIDDDRNMAALLSLRPSHTIEESQTVTRNKILNSPALPSSSGFLTSFGGLKKEESLNKCMPLTRNSLGITIKRSKSDSKDRPDTVSDTCKITDVITDKTNEIKEISSKSDNEIDKLNLNKKVKNNEDNSFEKKYLNINVTSKGISKDNFKIEYNLKSGDTEGLIKTNSKDSLDKTSYDAITEKTVINNVKFDISFPQKNVNRSIGFSLVGDYSSSGESTE